jgi:hypothetical protein
MTTWNIFTSKQKMAVELAFDALSTMDGITDRRDTFKGGIQRIGFSDLYSFVTSSDSMMDEKLERALEQDGRLRGELDRLLERTAVYRFPKLAAASSGKADHRGGEGFLIRLKQSRAEQTQTYVIIELAPDFPEAPKILFLRSAPDRYIKHPLPEAHDGVIQVLAEEDSDLVRALRKVDTEVSLH